jgi:hypothetical protein
MTRVSKCDCVRLKRAVHSDEAYLYYIMPDFSFIFAAGGFRCEFRVLVLGERRDLHL